MVEDDKFEYLAYEQAYQNDVESFAKPFWDKINDDKSISIEAFYNVLVQGL